MPTKKVVHQRTYEKKHVSEGLCRVCPDTATHGVFCRRHWRKALLAKRKRLGNKRKNKPRFG